jgi:hypothetical protein
MPHPQASATVVVGVATRDLRANEPVMHGDIIVQGYAQVRADVPMALVKQWRREQRRRKRVAALKLMLSPFQSLRVPIIHLLGGLDAAEVVTDREGE